MRQRKLVLRSEIVALLANVQFDTTGNHNTLYCHSVRYYSCDQDCSVSCDKCE